MNNPQHLPDPISFATIFQPRWNRDRRTVVWPSRSSGQVSEFASITEASNVTPQCGTIHLSIVRESDRRIIGTRQFTASAPAATGDTAALVNAFHTAVSEILADGVAWVLGQTR